MLGGVNLSACVPTKLQTLVGHCYRLIPCIPARYVAAVARFARRRSMNVGIVASAAVNWIETTTPLSTSYGWDTAYRKQFLLDDLGCNGIHWSEANVT